MPMDGALGLTVFAARGVGVGWYIAETDQSALLVLHFDRGGKNDILALTEFLGLNFAEDGYSFQVDNRAVSALCMNGLNSIAGSMVDNAVFDEQFAFDITYVHWPDDAVVDGDLSWGGVEGMMLGLQAVGHERAMQDFEIQAAVDSELAIDQKAAELQMCAALFAVYVARAVIYGSDAVRCLDY